MKQGFIKVAAVTPDIKVADCEYNAEQIIKNIDTAQNQEVRVLIFPELCITGYTCSDLFFQDTLLCGALTALDKIVNATKGKKPLVMVGLPILKDAKLYNVAAVICDGTLLGMIPKRFIPNYSEFYERRHFTEGNDTVEYVNVNGTTIPFGTKLLFANEEISSLVVAAEICEDVWVPMPPSTTHCIAGATVVANLSASNEVTGKETYRSDLVIGQSARLMCAYIYASAGEGESTTDLVFSGHNMIAENGTLLKESERFKNQMIATEVDLTRLVSERRKMSTYQINKAGYCIVPYSYSDLKEAALTGKLPETTLTRKFEKTPFVPANLALRKKRCEEITMIQAMGLKKRIQHIGLEHVVIGISGGLDSTLALLVAVRAFDLAGLDRSGIIAVTMPCFGTTDRTYQNAVTLVKELGASLKEIRINEAVLLHMKDIGHDANVHDVTYENSQARERTQVLMDLSNEYNAIVVGTGDMSELALGWATYNGDHMSMYGVNASVPKTLVRYLVEYFADAAESDKLKAVLLDILDTPVSPELLPPKKGEITQKTEDIVGPYELHDFFLYYILRFGCSPAKVYRLAVYAFGTDYSREEILKWLRKFYWRFFSQQFKRSCLPDGPKVGSVAVSPRGDLRMPSDACVNLWIKELETIKL